MLHAFNSAAPRTQIAHDHAGIILRRHHFHRHYWLEKYRRGFACRLFECHGSGNLESHLVRVNVVVAAVEKRRLHIPHRIAGEDSAFERLLNTLIDRLNEFLRNGAADDVIDELVSCPWRLRIEINFCMPERTASAGLPDVLALSLGVPADRLAI